MDLRVRKSCTNLSRQTGSSRFITSKSAVFDGDVHQTRDVRELDVMGFSWPVYALFPRSGPVCSSAIHGKRTAENVVSRGKSMSRDPGRSANLKPLGKGYKSAPSQSRFHVDRNRHSPGNQRHPLCHHHPSRRRIYRPNPGARRNDRSGIYILHRAALRHRTRNTSHPRHRSRSAYAHHKSFGTARFHPGAGRCARCQHKR